MGQKNLIRTQFEPREVITTPANDNKQIMAFTGYFEIGDTVDVIEVDTLGNVLSVIADNLTVAAIDPNTSLTLSAVVDTTGLVGTPVVRCQSIDDGFSAMDRLYRKPRTGAEKLIRREPIVSQELNQPVAGKTLFRVANTRFIKAGDIFDIYADEGLVATDVVIDSVSVQADASNNMSWVVITTVVDTSTFANPFLLAKDISLQDAIERNQEKIDGIDSPIENEDMEVLNGTPNSSLSVFETANLFVQNSSKLLLDGSRRKLGTKGTLASLVQGAGNSELSFFSNILGTDGNKTKLRVVAGAGFTIAVTGNFNVGYSISINDNGGAATSKELADALNAHATVKRIGQAIYGGTGAGVVAAFAYTNLTGGLNDGTGDYAELEQVYRNNRVNTGFKFVSFNIRPNEQNRMSKPPEDDEELVIDYRKATVNIDY